MTEFITCLKNVSNVSRVYPSNSAILVKKNALSNSKDRLKLKEDISREDSCAASAITILFFAIP